MNGRCLWAGMEVGGGGGGSSQARDVGAVDGSQRLVCGPTGERAAGERGERELRQTGGVYTLGSVVRSAASSIWPKH